MNAVLDGEPASSTFDAQGNEARLIAFHHTLDRHFHGFWASKIESIFNSQRGRRGCGGFCTGIALPADPDKRQSRSGAVVGLAGARPRAGTRQSVSPGEFYGNDKLMVKMPVLPVYYRVKARHGGVTAPWLVLELL